MKARIVILGAGFAGLELSTFLSERLGERADVLLIDQADVFIFGFEKLDVLFGHNTTEAIRHPYSDFAKPGVRFVREVVTAIDPAGRRVTTNAGTYDADFLVIALGADYDVSSTPGVVLGENEFYSVEGAVHMSRVLPTFQGGHAVIGVCWAPYKCPPAPSECAFMLHDYLVERGVRDASTITLVVPLPTPIPPSPETSRALLAGYAERGITWIAARRPVSVDTAGHRVTLDDGTELPCDLFLGVPRQRAPDPVVAAGLTEGGWVTVNPRTLETSFPRVYAVGDLAATGAPKAGVFAESAARVVGERILQQIREEDPTVLNDGLGTCYVEFGGGLVAQIEVNFFGGPAPQATFHEPTLEIRADKQQFASSRTARWFARERQRSG